MSKKCLVIGATMLDIILTVKEIPTVGSETYASSSDMTVGGCAYNVANILKRFDTAFTFLSPIGTGHYGNLITEKLGAAGFTTRIKSDKGDNGYCLCLVDNTGERTFITVPGIECSWDNSWFDRIDGDDFDCVYICGYEVETCPEIVDFCMKNTHLTVFYAPGPRMPYVPYNHTLFSLSPILHLNENEALSFTECDTVEEAGASLFAKTNNTVVITLGAKGCYYVTTTGGALVPGKTVTVVDTIGAGDAHVGALIAGWQRGLSMYECICQANTISAMVVETKGPTLSN